MIPDFNKNTIDTLAKRAGYICSNPDCRVKTVGPNSDTSKSTMIGEAAHIHGARPNSKRYVSDMTDTTRAEITNAIWLCRNCHKLIDTDENYYSHEVLFKWREIHEKYILAELGNRTALIRQKQFQFVLDQFEKYPPIIRRILTDKPRCWEYRLTAELMHYLNKPLFRKLKDLRSNLYLKTQNHLDEDEVFDWIQKRLTEILRLTEPIESLLDQLNKSWGEPGKEGDIYEIHHSCILIRDYIEQIVEYEELLRFTNVPEEYDNLKSPLQDLIGSQVMKIEKIPDRLQEIITLIISSSKETSEETITISETLTFKLPDNWLSDFRRALKQARE